MILNHTYEREKQQIKRKVFCRMIAAVALAAVFLLPGCGSGNRETVYEDLQAAFAQSGMLSANIGIFSKTEKDGSVSYGEGGSGVIIEKADGVYYALTAAHVVSDPDAQLLVFTVNTEMKSDEIPGIADINVLSQETYESMYPARTEYVSDRDDLAVIRFSSEEDLAVAPIAAADPEKEDRILCVGNPQNEWFALSYGKVTSGIETFGEAHGFPSNAMRHTAYIQVGSSGGAAFNAQMQLAGTTPGGSFSPSGKTFRYGVLIPASELRLCIDSWKQQ